MLHFTVIGKVTNTTKYSEANGSISASTVVGGSGQFLYSWSDTKNIKTSNRNSLKAGKYILEVSDATAADVDPIVHLFVVRQPRERVSAPHTGGNAKPSGWSAGRNQYFIDEAPSETAFVPPVSAGNYMITPQGITESGTNPLALVNNAWTAEQFRSTSTVIAAPGEEAVVTLNSGGIELSRDAAIYFGLGTWRLRFEPVNTELIFENLIDGVWSRRMIID